MAKKVTGKKVVKTGDSEVKSQTEMMLLSELSKCGSLTEFAQKLVEETLDRATEAFQEVLGESLKKWATSTSATPTPVEFEAGQGFAGRATGRFSATQPNASNPPKAATASSAPATKKWSLVLTEKESGDQVTIEDYAPSLEALQKKFKNHRMYSFVSATEVEQTEE